MKNFVYMIGFFIVLLIAVTVWKDRQISKLEKRLEQVAPPETVSVVITQRDTMFVKQADTTINEVEVKGDTVYVYRKMFDLFEQPLFELNIWANSRTEKFTYDLRYRPLKIYLLFKNKFDIRKGFSAYTIPDVGKVNVDFGNYTPVKKSKSFRIGLGLGYSKQLGPFLLSDIAWKKNAVGVFLKEESYGVYLKRQIW